MHKFVYFSILGQRQLPEIILMIRIGIKRKFLFFLAHDSGFSVPFFVSWCNLCHCQKYEQEADDDGFEKRNDKKNSKEHNKRAINLFETQIRSR